MQAQHWEMAHRQSHYRRMGLIPPIPRRHA
jgi:hypothetical protein